MGAWSSIFPLAEQYWPGVRPSTGILREHSPAGDAFDHTERHLQCLWADDRWRPRALKNNQGEDVIVEHPGVWNLEAGPDFLGALLLIGPDRRRVTGDVEVHIRPSDWLAHGHAKDLRYARVCAHVAWFRGSIPADLLPPGAVQISLAEAVHGNPEFSFEQIDLTAYPYAARAAAVPCSLLLANWPPDRLGALLDSAGEERLRRKAERLMKASAGGDLDQLAYEEALAALGYKHNKIAGRELARRVPMHELRETAGRDTAMAYAILAGVSGLLPDQPKNRWDDESRMFHRRIWDLWWPVRNRWDQRLMSPDAWRLSALRPGNHPARRLWAAAGWFTTAAAPGVAWTAIRSFRSFCALLQSQPESYWNTHYTWGGKGVRPTQIVGNDRIAALAINVLVPLLAATGAPAEEARRLLAELPPEQDNVRIRQTAFTLFGRDAPPALYRTALRGQGLMQIFQDFCLNDRSRCGACPFPDWLSAQ